MLFELYDIRLSGFHGFLRKPEVRIKVNEFDVCDTLQRPSEILIKTGYIRLDVPASFPREEPCEFHRKQGGCQRNAACALERFLVVNQIERK